MKFYELITEGSNDSYYAYHDAAKKWAKDTGKDPREFSRAGTDVQDEYIEPEMKKHGLVPDKYMGKGVTSYKRESLEAIARHVKEGIALCDSPFRHGSQAYLETFQYAKKLREAGALPELDWESEEMLATDVGESVKLKNGETVWLDIPYLIEDEEGMIGTPDEYYDADERTEAYKEMQDNLDRFDRNEQEYIKDGICPGCGGNGYMDGEEEVYNDETGDYEEGSECDGVGIFGCDQGEITGANWLEIIQHDERQAERKALKDKPQPSDEELENAMNQLHKDYVKSGRMNAFELPGILRQMYPEISKPKAREIGGKFLTSFGEAIDQGSSEGEMIVAKMLAKALGDDNRWTEMSPSELYSELESVNPEAADMIRDVAKLIYDVKLEERAYKDVGIADVVKDQRGKEFKFDKGSKKFKAVDDGEEADVKTKLGKDLMRIRRNAMKRTSPSYPKNKKMMDGKSPHKKGTAKYKKHMAAMHAGESVTNEAEYNGKKVKLNKPMRSSGGGKKYKVYVKNPKTGRVKKISFGDAGLKTKSGNKKRAKSFAARHNCEKKNDKMKAGYWACRLPRYGLVKGGKWW